MNQKLIATQIAQQIWSETGEMYRVGVSERGHIEINVDENDPIMLIKKAVCGMENIRFRHKSVTLHFKLKETEK